MKNPVTVPKTGWHFALEPFSSFDDLEVMKNEPDFFKSSSSFDPQRLTSNCNRGIKGGKWEFVLIVPKKKIQMIIFE